MPSQRGSRKGALPVDRASAEMSNRGGLVSRANDILKNNQIRWVQVHFTDLLGGLRSFTVPVEDLFTGKLWGDGIGFDGASVKGFAQVEASDMRAIPDPATLSVLRLGENVSPLARVMAEVFNPRTGLRLESDPRNIAARSMAHLSKAGFTEAWISPELEFTLFHSPQDAIVQNDVWNPASSEGAGHLRVIPELLGEHHPSHYTSRPANSYFAAPPLDETDPFRNEFASLLHDLGIPVKFHHHENGAGQVEVELKAMPGPVQMGDACVTYKFLARLVAQRHGLVPTFMPKPVQADSGNGMHVHISLWTGGQSAFYDGDDKYHMSQSMRYFVGGLLDHARGTAAITNPTVNSYKRLVPEYEAPVFISWSPVNRTALVRIPARHAHADSINCEPRHPDPSANPYLVFSVLLESGLDGIRRKTDPGPPVNENIFRMSPERLRELGIGRLPSSLGEALDEMESDELVRRVLGAQATDSFLELKRKEWRVFSNNVSTWEHAMYFHI
jgi:glutamine synthetase